MRINCLGCGHLLDIGDDYDDYKGPAKCNICGATLEIRTEEGNVKSTKLLADPRCCPCDEGSA